MLVPRFGMVCWLTHIFHSRGSITNLFLVLCNYLVVLQNYWGPHLAFTSCNIRVPKGSQHWMRVMSHTIGGWDPNHQQDMPPVLNQEKPAVKMLVLKHAKPHETTSYHPNLHWFGIPSWCLLPRSTQPSNTYPQKCHQLWHASNHKFVWASLGALHGHAWTLGAITGI